MSDPTSRLPARPSLEQLRKQAKDLLRFAREGESAAAARIRAAGGRAANNPRDAVLADAQLVVAREHGFASWANLAHHVQALSGQSSLQPLIRPVEMAPGSTYTLEDGSLLRSDDVYQTFVAARAGGLGDLRSLIERDPRLALVEYNYTPPIHFAVREGHRAIVELLIARGADLAYRTYPFGDSLLMMAQEREHEDVAALLRHHLANRFRVASGTTAIMEAARAGDIGAVQRELARDQSLARASNETGDTALHQAAHRCHMAVVRALLDAGADPDAERGGDGYRPIHLALMPSRAAGDEATFGPAIAELLLARGVRYTMFVAALRGDHAFIRDALRRDRSLANEMDTCGARPISAAVQRNDAELVRLLLENGADPSAPERGAPRGHALWSAVHERRHELVRLLLEHGADPNGMVESSGRPIDQARHDPELLTLLTEHGGVLYPKRRDELGRLIDERRFADIERMLRKHPELLHDDGAGWGDGILAGSANSGDNEMLALLIRLGARVPTVTKWAPYYYFKHEATARFLLENGMDAHHMNWHRFTLLHHMAAEGALEKARLLVNHGAEIDAIDDEYRSTPLGVAARRGQRALVEFLLDQGADPVLAGASWATPYAWAEKRGHRDVAEFLASKSYRSPQM